MINLRQYRRYLFMFAVPLIFCLLSPVKAAAQCDGENCLDDGNGHSHCQAIGGVSDDNDCETPRGGCGNQCTQGPCITELASKLLAATDQDLRNYLRVGCLKESTGSRFVTTSLKQFVRIDGRVVVLKTVRQFDGPAFIVSSVHSGGDLLLAGRLLNLDRRSIAEYRIDYAVIRGGGIEKMVGGRWTVESTPIPNRSVRLIPAQHITYGAERGVIIAFFVGAIKFHDGSSWTADRSHLALDITPSGQ